MDRMNHAAGGSQAPATDGQHSAFRSSMESKQSSGTASAACCQAFNPRKRVPAAVADGKGAIRCKPPPCFRRFRAWMLMVLVEP